MHGTEPSVALVFSPEVWVEDLHRHLSHHGGARVRQIVVEPSIALEEDYEVLVVSDRWPALTFGFVGAVHARGRSILGVFDPDEPAGKDHLLELGVDATIAGDADVVEFVTALRALDVAVRGHATRPLTTPSRGSGFDDGGGGAVVGGSVGGGAVVGGTVVVVDVVVTGLLLVASVPLLLSQLATPTDNPALSAEQQEWTLHPPWRSVFASTLCARRGHYRVQEVSADQAVGCARRR